MLDPFSFPEGLEKWPAAFLFCWILAFPFLCSVGGVNFPAPLFSPVDGEWPWSMACLSEAVNVAVYFDSYAAAVHQKSMPQLAGSSATRPGIRGMSTIWFWPAAWSWRPPSHSYPRTGEQEMHVVTVSYGDLRLFTTPARADLWRQGLCTLSCIPVLPWSLVKWQSHHVFKAGAFWCVNDFIAPTGELPGIKRLYISTRRFSFCHLPEGRESQEPGLSGGRAGPESSSPGWLGQ